MKKIEEENLKEKKEKNQKNNITKLKLATQKQNCVSFSKKQSQITNHSSVENSKMNYCMLLNYSALEFLFSIQYFYYHFIAVLNFPISSFFDE